MRDHSSIEIGERRLAGDLYLVRGSHGLVVFVHGKDSSRHSRRNLRVAQTLQRHQLSTLLFDLHTPEEARQPALPFDTSALADRVLEAIDALPATLGKPRIGLYGASAGTDVALHAAARRPDAVHAIVSRGGQMEVEADLLHQVKAPTLLIAGAADTEVMRRNREAVAELGGEKRFDVIARATHLFQEAGALETVARLASDWFEAWLRPLGDSAVQ
jgi:putative phosphoribosyl transferase